jgi:hypothetical protein
MTERPRVQIRVLSEAGALPDGKLDEIQRGLTESIEGLFKSIEDGTYVRPQFIESTFIPIEELLTTKYVPNKNLPKVIPFKPKTNE